MDDDKFGQFVQLAEHMKFSDDFWSKEHSCEPYLCTNEDCSHADEGEHYHQDLCMHRECAEPAFKILAATLKAIDDEITEKMLSKRR